MVSGIGGEDAEAVQVLLHIGSDSSHISVCVESVQFVLLFIELDDWLGLVVEHFQSLCDGLLIVVSPSAGLASL